MSEPTAKATRAALDEMARDAYEAGLYDRKVDAAAMVQALRAAMEPNESIYDSPPRELPYHEVCDSPECDRCRSCRCESPDCPMCATSARIAARAGLERESDALAAHAAGMAKLEPQWPKPQPALVERTYRVTLSVTVDVGMEMDGGGDASKNAMLHAEREIEKRLDGARSLAFVDIEAMEVEEKK